MNTLRCLFYATGQRVDFPEPLTMADIRDLIGAQTTDQVVLVDGRHVMIVDDQGHAKGLPLNETGTRLYWERCGGEVDHYIVGDVVVVPDSDFAGSPLNRMME
jgi:Domain of unknown function (DUF3846)